MKTKNLQVFISLIACVMAPALFSSSALAASIAVANNSFESPAQTSGGSSVGYEGDASWAITSWTVGGGSSSAGVINGGSPAYSPIAGLQVAYANAGANPVSLTTSSAVTAITANTTYTLSVFVGNRSDGAANNGSYTISLTDNGQIVNPVTLAGAAIGAGTFTTMTASYTPPVSSAGHFLGIKLSFASTNGSSSQGAFDYVQLNSAAGTSVAGTSFTFTLPSSYTTSAGIYNSTGVLVRTLWRKVFYNAGTYTQSWDGHDDYGNAVAAGNYTVKILYHNLHYVWDGVIANTSSSFSSAAARHGIGPIMGLAVNGTTAFEARGYNEGQQEMYGFTTTAPQTMTIGLGNADNTYSLNWNLVANDGTKVYYACPASNNTSAMTTTNPGIIVAYNIASGANYAFPAGSSFYNCPDWLDAQYPSYTWPNGVHVGTQPGIQGLAVQNSGSYLALAVGPDNLVYLLDKASGSVVKTISVTNPKAVAFAQVSGDLWVLSGTSALRYTNISSTPTLATTIGGFSNPLAIAAHPSNDNIILIADGGTSQQVKGYTSTGAAASGWSAAFGTVGGNKLAGPAVTNTKFWFTGGNDLQGFGSSGEYTYLTIGSDGSFWLGDNGNNRNLHFTSARAYIEQIAFLPDTLTCNVDANNSARVFAGFLEYQVDYTKPLLPGDPYATGGNKAWKLVNNWASGVSSSFIGFMNGPFSVATLSNGHTYSLIRQPSNYTPIQVAELASNGLRITNDSTLTFGFNDHFELEADGSIRYASIAGGTVTWYTLSLTGYDASFNPLWASANPLATAPAGPNDPTPQGQGDGYIRFPITASNVLVSLNTSTTDPGMHLGGVILGASSWLWEAAPAGALDYLGTYDLNAQYAGDVTMGLDHSIIYGYNGEFGPGGETNQFMHFYDDGLFVGEFGILGGTYNATAGGAGNDFSPQLVKVSGEKYMWHNDESQHGGIHRWHLLGESGIQEASATGAMNTSINVVIPAQAFPSNVVALPGATKAVVSWSPVSGATSYTIKYSTTSGGPYTTLSSGLTATTYTKTGLANGTKYYFTVSALVAGVQSANSNEARVTPFDTTVSVQSGGSLYGGDYDQIIYTISSANLAAGLPAFPSIASDILGNLWQYSVGSQGYAVFHSNTSSSINTVSPITVTQGAGWNNGQYIGKQFSIDGVPEYFGGGLGNGLASTAGASITITSPDGNWHCLSVFCPTSFSGPMTYTLTLTPQGLSTPTASYSPVNTSYDGWFQFIFKGNVTLTETGAVGIIKALCLDPVNVAVAPVAPTGLTATAGTHQVSLTWATTANATSYNIYRGTSAGGESTTAIATGVVLTTYTDTGLTTGTHYYYKIKAVNGVGTSGYSNEANAISL